MVVEGAADQQGLVAIRKAEGSASPVDEPLKPLGCGRGIVEGVEKISGPVGVVGIGYETLDDHCPTIPRSSVGMQEQQPRADCRLGAGRKLAASAGRRGDDARATGTCDVASDV